MLYINLHIIVCENKGNLIIIDRYFNDHSLRSIVLPYAQALSLLFDAAARSVDKGTIEISP